MSFQKVPLRNLSLEFHESACPPSFPQICLVIPIPNQIALFVGSVYGPSTYYLYASVAFFLAALISSLI